LRPSLFSEFTGQAKVKERLEIAVAAAQQRGEALDHILLSGPPGLGKNTLALHHRQSDGHESQVHQRSDYREGGRPPPVCSPTSTKVSPVHR